MSFSFEFSDKLKEILSKLARRDNALAIAVRKKIGQIISCDEMDIKHFKNLRGNMSHLKRVHVGSFVLTFQVKENIIIFENFDHHDKIYKK
ncbi:MAG: addiction module toxin RelE [Nanoarchaeota archaeon]|nr:addiction module toxin RelE [Nanoarchaeota archaeon]